MVTALAGALTSLYQWIELHELRTTGEAPLCSVTETVDCAVIWNAPLSTLIHQTTGIPFPGWGLVWSAIVLFLGVMLLFPRATVSVANWALALRLTGSIAALVSIGLLIYSITIGVLCPTCLIFYICVGIATYVSFRHISTANADWLMAGLQSIALLAIGVLLVVYPGMQTPLDERGLRILPQAATSTSQPMGDIEPVSEFINSLNPELKQVLSDTRFLHKNAPSIARSTENKRITFGPTASPVHIVEWIDIRCPHCRDLHLALDEIGKVTEPGSWHLETRHYPLDAECNGNIPRSDNTGVRCLAAKMLICLAGTEAEKPARSAFFEQQKELNVELLWSIAATNEAERKTLESCVSEKSTEQALQQDIAYAETHGIQGTPLTVINGRAAPALPALIYALILARGDYDHHAFGSLPPPNADL